MSDLNDVMHLLGRVQFGVETLQKDFHDEKRSAAESRAVIHRRLDEQAGQIADLKTSMALAVQVDTQLHDKVDKLANRVTPALMDLDRMKALGMGIGGLLAIGGLSLGSILIWAGEAFWTWVRHKLGL